MITHQALGLTRRQRRTSVPQIPESCPNVLGLISGKGGVGKTTLAVNLASAAARAGRRVLVIDGDAGLANAELLMGLVPRFDLDDWIAGVPLEEVLCPGPYGLSLLVSGSGRSAQRTLAAALAGQGENALCERIKSADLTLLDLGAGIGGPLMDLAIACPSLWLIATPEPTSLADAYATLKRVAELGRSESPQIELLVNRARTPLDGDQTHGSLSRMSERFLGRAIPLRGVVPEDAALHRSILRQSPIVLDARSNAAARRLELLAESLVS